MANDVTAIIPLPETTLSIQTVGNILTLLECRLNNLSKSFHANDCIYTGGRSVVKSDISTDLTSIRFFLRATVNNTRKIIHVHTQAYTSFNEITPGPKIIISTGCSNGGAEILRAITSGMKGYIVSDEETFNSRNFAIEEKHKITETDIHCTYTTRGKEAQQCSVPLMDLLLFPRIIDVFNLGGTINNISHANTVINTNSGVISIFDEDHTAAATITTSNAFPQYAKERHGKFKIHKPAWASHVLTNKSNPNIVVFAKRKDSGYVGGYELNPNDFTHSYDKEQWSVKKIN